MNAFLIYLWGIADNVSITFGLLSLFLGVSALACAIASTMVVEYDSEVEAKKKEAARKPMRKLAKWAAISLVASAIIPSSNTIAVMVILPSVAESKAIREDIPQIYDAAIEKLKESLELNPTVEK